jgi:hypothetical protein
VRERDNLGPKSLRKLDAEMSKEGHMMRPGEKIDAYPSPPIPTIPTRFPGLRVFWLNQELRSERIRTQLHFVPKENKPLDRHKA